MGEPVMIHLDESFYSMVHLGTPYLEPDGDGWVLKTRIRRVDYRTGEILEDKIVTGGRMVME